MYLLSFVARLSDGTSNRRIFILGHFVGDFVQVEPLAVVIGRDHVMVHHHGDAPGVEPSVQSDMVFEEGLGSSLSVQEFG